MRLSHAALIAIATLTNALPIGSVASSARVSVNRHEARAQAAERTDLHARTIAPAVHEAPSVRSSNDEHNKKSVGRDIADTVQFEERAPQADKNGATGAASRK